MLITVMVMMQEMCIDLTGIDLDVQRKRSYQHHLHVCSHLVWAEPVREVNTDIIEGSLQWPSVPRGGPSATAFDFNRNTASQPNMIFLLCRRVFYHPES